MNFYLISRIIGLLIVSFMVGGTSPTSRKTLTDSGQLWFLASDEEYANANLFRVDTSVQRITDEIDLPDQLIVGEALLSADSQYVAIVIGERQNITQFIGTEICLLNIDGDILWCREHQILTLPNVYGGFVSAKITWSIDGNLLLASQPTDNGVIHILTLDVADGKPISDIEASVSTNTLGEWHWLPSANYVAFTLWDRDQATYRLYGMTISAEDTPRLIERGIGISTIVTKSAVAYSKLNSSGQIQIWMVDVVDHPHFEPQNIALIEENFGEFSMSPDIESMAFTSRVNGTETNSRSALYVLVFRQDNPTVVDTSQFWIDQLTWSEDGRALAYRSCQGRGPHLCSVKVYMVDSDLMLDISSSYISHTENRNPIWITE